MYLYVHWITVSHCIYKLSRLLRQSVSLCTLNHYLHVDMITSFQCISKVFQLHPPRVSPYLDDGILIVYLCDYIPSPLLFAWFSPSTVSSNLLNFILQVQLLVYLITPPWWIYIFYQSQPPSLYYHSLQVDMDSLYASRSNSLNYCLDMYLHLCRLILSLHISMFTV